MEARSGTELIQLLETRTPDVVLLDFNLPDRDGLSVLRELRREEFTGGIIFITGAGSEKIAVVSLDNSARVYDVESGDILFPLEGHSAAILDVVWSPDGKYIATDSHDGKVRVWDAGRGIELHSFRHFRSEEMILNSIDWSPDGGYLLVMGGRFNQIWDLSLQPLRLIGHSKVLNNASWSPDGSSIATASIDGTARIWDASDGKLLKTLTHTGVVESLTWSPDSSQLATSDQDGTVKVWQLDANRSRQLPNPDDIRFSSLSWSPDGERIVASSQSDLIAVIYDVDSGEATVLEQGDLTCYLSSPSWSPGGDRFVTGCVKREVKETPARIWQADTGDELERLESTDGNSLAAAWSPDGKSIAVAYAEMAIRIWDTDSYQPVSSYSGHADIIADLHWSPNSERVVSADGGGFVRVWQAATGDEILSFKSTSSLNSIEWSPDGQYVIAATLQPAPEIYRVWQSTQALVDYAEECCVWRELTIGERQQFGLPIQ